MASTPNLARILPLLQCPHCTGRLKYSDTQLLCQNCGERFSVVDGVPDFLNPPSGGTSYSELESVPGRRMVEEYQNFSTPDAEKKRLAWLSRLKPPSIMLRYWEDIQGGPAKPLFTGTAGRTILNVGGGPTRVCDDEIVLNIGHFTNVDLVADAHEIPLRSDSVDAVFSLAVLEHVADPARVVSEMIRVLKPGGYLYSEVPFIFFFHGYPTDYTRYTREGMQRLFQGLEESEVGLTHGPFSAVLQSANMLISLLISSRFRITRKIANGLFRTVFFPVKYLDLVVRDHPEAHTLAGGFYVVGRKPCRD